jgi:hypothetical protein
MYPRGCGGFIRPGLFQVASVQVGIQRKGDIFDAGPRLDFIPRAANKGLLLPHGLRSVNPLISPNLTKAIFPRVVACVNNLFGTKNQSGLSGTFGRCLPCLKPILLPIPGRGGRLPKCSRFSPFISSR